MISKTPYYSWKLNKLPKGCTQCAKGEKLVMFVTGICPRQCPYCPLSEQKKDKDVIFANERQLDDENSINDMIAEARACKSKGAGFTGGDPLTRIDRTCKYIKSLKKSFGKKFHVHLYTSMELLNEKNLNLLNDAGLDELRFHPELTNNKLWSKVKLFYNKKGKRKYDFKIGIEIPVLPKSYSVTKKVVDYFNSYVDFINLNELEISDAESFKIKNVHVRNNTYYGAAGSQEAAFELLKYINKKYPLQNVHYCTCKLKDKIQLGKRLKKRAENTAKKFDIITEDGTILRGAIYLEKPGFNYKKKLLAIENKEDINKKLETIKEKLIKKYSIPNSLIEVDSLKLRLITNIGIVRELAKILKSQSLIPAIVEQYPTYDQMEVEVEFL
ncbi:MAG: radical SAM protein [Candidatus Woesearchaeota archaeon]